ncbi:MAG: gliding motility-associated C-terminal domain-containing protein, partial [Bacteroidota bacterium]
GTSPFTYSWAGGQTTSTISGLCAGAYTVTVTDAASATTTATVNITQPATSLTATATTTPASCLANNGSATVAASGGTTNYSYIWNTGGQTTSAATGLTAGTYTVTTTDANGCTATQTVSVTSSNPMMLSTASTPTGCTINNGTATANPSNGTSPYSYLWSNGQPTTIATGLAAGSYTVTTTDANGCTATQTVSVTQTPNPTVIATATPAVITIGNSVTLTATGGGNYLWSPTTNLSCTTCANPIASPTGTTIYCVTVTDINNCSDSDCVTITIQEPPCESGALFVPNAFSPNGDKDNEQLCVYGNCIKEVELFIYNRWGEKVFETTNITQCWDGTHGGKPLNTAVFVYYMKATLTTGEKIAKKGNVSLIR